MTYRWTTPIRYVRGLGPTRSQELTKIGITTVGELLERQPLSYIYPGVTPIADAKEGMVVVKARIKEIGLHPYSGRGVVQATLTDETGSCVATWYHSPWLRSQLRPGMTVTFWGKLRGGVLQQPRWTTVDSSLQDVAGGQYGAHHATIRAALKEVLANVELPDSWLGDMEYPRTWLFKSFHFPDSKDEQQRALAALKFDEALQLQLALAEKRRGRAQVKGEVIEL